MVFFLYYIICIILQAIAAILQIVESSFHKASADKLIGTFINASEVITVDGFRRDLIVVNDAFPGPYIEVMEGAQVSVPDSILNIGVIQ